MGGFPVGRVSQGRVSEKGEKPIAIKIDTRERVSEEGEFPRRERFILLYIYTTKKNKLSKVFLGIRDIYRKNIFPKN